MGGQYVSLEELLASSDIISLHCPLNSSTFHLIGAPQVARMKRGAILINSSRGGLMDTRAVIDGLVNGQVGALGMDVYEKEGPLFFTDFSMLNRSERMRGWDEQMGVRARPRAARRDACARSSLLTRALRRARCCCRCRMSSSRRTARSSPPRRWRTSPVRGAAARAACSAVPDSLCPRRSHDH